MSFYAVKSKRCKRMSVKTPKAIANIAKNRLHITIAGKLSKENLDKLYTEIRFCVNDLAPGFIVITDLSQCTIGFLSAIPTFRRITNYLIENKVGRVVRVVDEDKVILKQLINFTSNISGYKADHFQSLEEVETVLSNSEKRGSLRFVLYQHSIKFNKDGLEGDGFVYDISSSGCAIQTHSQIPAVNDNISISIKFKEHENLIDFLEVKAEVIWVEGELFGTRFENINEEAKEKLWERLVYETKCDLP